MPKVRKTKSTRSRSCPIIGKSAELPASELPTFRDVLALVLLKKERNVGPQESWCVAQEAAAEVKTAWAKVNSAIVTTKERSCEERNEALLLQGALHWTATST